MEKQTSTPVVIRNLAEFYLPITSPVQGETYTDCAPLYAKDRSNTYSPSKASNTSNTSSPSNTYNTSSTSSSSDTRPNGWVADSWCSTLTDSADNHQEGYWGNCGPIDQVGQ